MPVAKWEKRPSKGWQKHAPRENSEKKTKMAVSCFHISERTEPVDYMHFLILTLTSSLQPTVCPNILCARTVSIIIVFVVFFLPLPQISGIFASKLFLKVRGPCSLSYQFVVLVFLSVQVNTTQQQLTSNRYSSLTTSDNGTKHCVFHTCMFSDVKGWNSNKLLSQKTIKSRTRWWILTQIFVEESDMQQLVK